MARERRTRESASARMKSLSGAGNQALDVLATGVVVAATVAAVVLALHIVFTVFETNPDNPLVMLVGSLAGDLAWVFEDLFAYEREGLRTTVNYGLAAIVYLIVGRLIAKLLRRS